MFIKGKPYQVKSTGNLDFICELHVNPKVFVSGQHMQSVWLLFHSLIGFPRLQTFCVQLRPPYFLSLIKANEQPSFWVSLAESSLIYNKS